MDMYDGTLCRERLEERRVKGAIRLDRGSQTHLFIIQQTFTGVLLKAKYKARHRACLQVHYTSMKKATVNSDICWVTK